MNKNSNNVPEIIEIIKNPKLRAGLCKHDHLMFFNVYLNSYVKYGIAKFQKEIFKLTENIENMAK